LDPNLNMWSTAEPVIRAWIEENLGPSGKMRDAGEALGVAVQALARAPEMLERIDALTEQLRNEKPGKSHPPADSARWQVIPLWLLAAAAVIALLR
ncbi:MAG: ubiquinone biosynthesis protein UbiB, partial [Hyphomicrobiales bacterium]|nr:ubiquinone biosynthesis protein UbiB [Hyphomicrobiales bacterium]